jgi:hypothetical protein
MIQLQLKDNNDIKIITEEFEFLKEVKEYFTEYVDGFMFMPKYKAGQ